MSVSMLVISNLAASTIGTKYTSRIGVEAANGTGKKVESDVQKAMAESNIRLRAIIEAGTRFDV
jgi:hypothetical protein